MAKDRLGQPLEVGDFVSACIQCQFNQTHTAHIFGRVVKVQDGGVVVTGARKGNQPQQTPCIVKVVFECDFGCGPGENMPTVLKVTDPSPPKKALITHE